MIQTIDQLAKGKFALYRLDQLEPYYEETIEVVGDTEQEVVEYAKAHGFETEVKIIPTPKHVIRRGSNIASIPPYRIGLIK